MIEWLCRADDTQFTESATLRIAGSCCFVRTNSKALLRTVGRWCSTDPADATHSFRLNVTVRDECDAVPSEPRFRGLRHIVFASWRDACFAVFDLLRREIAATISRRCAEDKLFWNAHFLPIALGVLGPAINAVPVHCACLDADGTGLLIAGESGAGKSTMAVALAMRGLSLISDDWTYVNAESPSTLSAHGVLAPVKLLPDAITHFPTLRAFDQTIALNGELSYEVDPATAFGIAVKNVCQPAMLVFLRRTESGQARLSRVDASVARRYLIDSSERLPDELHRARVHRQRALEILSCLPCYLFQYSGNPHSGASALQSALADLVARSNDVLTDQGSSFTIRVPPPPDLLRRFSATPHRSSTVIGHTRLALETNNADLLQALTTNKRPRCADHATWKCIVLVDGEPHEVARRPREPISEENLTLLIAPDVIALRYGARTFICIDVLHRELLGFVDPRLPPQIFADLVRAAIHDFFPTIAQSSGWATAP